MKFMAAVCLFFISNQSLRADEMHEKIVLSFYQRIFIALATPTNDHKEIANYLNTNLKQASALQRHFFLETSSETETILMRCELPCKDSPGNKLIVSSVLSIKSSDPLHLALKKYCSEDRSL